MPQVSGADMQAERITQPQLSSGAEIQHCEMRNGDNPFFALAAIRRNEKLNVDGIGVTDRDAILKPAKLDSPHASERVWTRLEEAALVGHDPMLACGSAIIGQPDCAGAHEWGNLDCHRLWVVQMKRLVLRSFSLDGLQMEDAPAPACPEGFALIRVRAAGLNPSDVMNIMGGFHYTSLPRVPGRDYSGIVEEGPREWIGKAVWGSGAELGFSCDGSYSECMAVPSDSLVEKPADMSFAAAAGAGVPFATAYQAIVQATNTQPGETVLVSGAMGAVGSAACQIALQRGARVMGMVKDKATFEGVELILSSDDVVKRVREATAGRGAEVALDTVSGPLFPLMIEALAIEGRLAVIVAKGDGKVTLDLRDLYRRKLQLLGVNSLLVDSRETAEIYRELNPLIESGKLKSEEPKQISFGEVRAAFENMMKGSVPKMVLVPA